MDTRQSRQRSPAGSHLSWSSLPQHLMDLIFTKAGANGGQSSFASMRRVCKAWHAAFMQGPWTVDPPRVRKFRDLQKLCKMIPNMRSLTLSNLEVHVRLAPLSVLSGLTELKVRGDNLPGWGSGQLYVNLSGLPKSLLKLQLRSIDVPPLCLSTLGLANLRFLSLYNRFHGLPVLLQNLPKLEKESLRQAVLKELEIGGEGAHLLNLLRNSSGKGDPWCPNLIRLQFYSGSVPHTKDSTFKTLLGLQSISFSDTKLSTDMLNLIGQATPGLTFLHLKGCTFIGQQSLVATGKLRYLVLEDVDFPYALTLADEKLHSLTLRIETSATLQQPTLQHLARLSGLIRLELEGWYKQKMAGSLSGLQLEELVVIDCGDLLLQLFEPGTLNALRKLHVECETFTSNYYEELAKEKQKLEKLGSIVSRLPQLCQISGVCDLFTVGMAKFLKGWHTAEIPLDTMSLDVKFHLIRVDHMKIWSKPDC